MGHYPCADCCGEEVDCTILNEPFTRADTTTIPGTTELNGDWANTGSELHPDHGDSDQRIRFDVTSSDTHCVVVARLKNGASSDRGGVCLFLDADGDSYVEATLEYGSGSAGRLNLNRFTNGVVDWTHNISSSPQCGDNLYDFPPGDSFDIALWHRTVEGGSLWTLQVFRAESPDVGFVAAPPQDSMPVAHYEVEYLDSAGVGALTGFEPGCVTGEAALTLTFDNVQFYHGYAPCYCTISTDYPTLHRNYACDFVGWKYVEEEGDWDQEMLFSFDQPPVGTPTYAGIVTYDEPATLLMRDIIQHAFAHSILFQAGVPNQWTWVVNGLRFRYFWDWADDDNYWCVEYEFGDFNPTIGSGKQCPDAIRIIERSGGSETEHYAVEDFDNRYHYYHGPSPGAFNLPVQITPNGYVMVYYGKEQPDCEGCVTVGSGLGVMGFGPFTFSGGRRGWKVMEAPNGFVLAGYVLVDGEAGCVPDGGFGYCDTADPPEEEDPPTPYGCCDEFDAIELGTTVEVEIENLATVITEPCFSDLCFPDLVTLIGLLDATHTLTCVMITNDTVVFFLQTDLDPPCETTPSSNTFRLTLWITRDDADGCRAVLEIWAGSTCVAYLVKEGLNVDESCEGIQLLYDAATNTADCCLDFTGSDAQVSFI